ncbi:MAG: hypothetical protein RLZ57_817 [Actinomycetota bacterium]|jgi:NAD(P)-dependent dehydrogenase (short-subunit alcohol dehydrogenase family)
MAKLLLTGATGQIGAGLKAHFEGKGFTVIAPNRNECDLAKSGAVTKYLLSINFAEIDYIINNAADQSVAELKSVTPEHINQMMQTNFNAIAEIYSFVANHSENLKSILNISSIEAINARPGHTIYGASKAALESLTKSAAMELKTIRTNALRLGLISRPGIQSSWPEGVNAWIRSTPLGRMGEINDVTSAADFLLTSEWITGEILTLDGGNLSNPGW